MPDTNSLDIFIVEIYIHCVIDGTNVASPSPKEEMVMEAMAMVETVMVAVMVEMEMVLAEMVPVETAVPELVSAIYSAITAGGKQ